MPTVLQPNQHTLLLQLARESVDREAGIIRGAVVARANVQAIGHYVFLDANGAVTRDERLAKRELPVFTDEKTLETLMTAAAAAGPRIKAREDHVDAIGARAGYSDAFKHTDDSRVIADIHLFPNYANREIVLDAATETPSEIGLSIDFTPDWEIQSDRALMRIRELQAVDIVDKGAITHGGLFLSVGVDSPANNETAEKSTTPMPPTLDEVMTQVTNLAKQMQECQAAIGKMTAPAPDPKVGEALAAVGEVNKQLSALNTDLSGLKQALGAIRKERAALGYRGNPADLRTLPSTATAEDIEKMNEGKKDYLTLVRETQETAKCSAVEAGARVRKSEAGRIAYDLHLASKGITVKAAAA